MKGFRNGLLFFVLILAVALGAGLAVSCSGDDDDDSDDDDDITDDDDDDDVGACCVGEVCSIATDADCEGEFQGVGTDCDPNPCVTDECADNHAPVLLGASYLVNGNFVDPPIDIDPEDAFGVYFEYEDEDCNLPGGEFWLNYDGAGYEAFPDPLPADLGCSTAQSGLVYGFSLQNPIEEGTHTFAVYWTDVCDEQSNEITGYFTVTAAD